MFIFLCLCVLFFLIQKYKAKDKGGRSKGSVGFSARKKRTLKSVDMMRSQGLSSSISSGKVSKLYLFV